MAAITNFVGGLTAGDAFVGSDWPLPAATAMPGVTFQNIFLNVADGWANVTDTGLTASGTVWLSWLFVDPEAVV